MQVCCRRFELNLVGQWPSGRTLNTPCVAFPFISKVVQSSSWRACLVEFTVASAPIKHTEQANHGLRDYCIYFQAVALGVNPVGQGCKINSWRAKAMESLFPSPAPTHIPVVFK